MLARVAPLLCRLGHVVFFELSVALFIAKVEK